MKRFLVLAVTFVLCGIVSVQAAGDEKNGHAYFTKAELPNMANILPAPPAFESARFVADQSQYLWGKLMRLDEARCAQAQRDAVYSMETIIAEFSGIFGLEITKEDTPSHRCEGILQPHAPLHLLQRRHHRSRKGREAPL